MADPRKGWDYQLEEGMPDSRLSWHKRESTMVKIGPLEYERVFCANCGAPKGLVNPEFAAHVFYVCDSCARKLGPPSGCIEVHEPASENE